ncbi:hypothetical protein [uncultured Dokdonia sp.]|uniref:hypothetical protein n=1 Tax=uncultured Dokdonia sp. TaxID=575653 RepID=UPI002601895C|nr:hypothetical protein [uncultured Dokdonia sp.]
MKYILSFFACLFISSLHAQIVFEEGYYINNAGENIEGFIKNSDWKNNPTDFEFKASMASDDSKNLSIKEVKEFGITNVFKYERHQVKIDRSSNDLKNLGYSREPEFKEETVFLKVLVENDVILYRYTDSDLTTFFYKSGENLYTLVYKRYINIQKKLDENSFYKQQLASDVNCTDKKMPNVENLRYTQSSLVKYFTAYGVCTGSATNKTFVKKVENSFNIKLVAGVQFTNFSVDSNMRRSVDFGSNVGFVPGIEFEYLLPFNAQKWALFLDFRYQSYEADRTTEVFVPSSNVFVTRSNEASYKGIDAGFGVRHYFLLSENSKFYLGLNYSIDFSNDTEVIYEDAEDFIASKATGVLGIGAGYAYDRLSAEFRYYTNRNSLGNEFLFQNSEYSNITFSLSYRLARF